MSKADTAIKQCLLEFYTATAKYEIDNRTHRIVPKSGIESMDRGTAKLARRTELSNTCPVSAKNIGHLSVPVFCHRYLWRWFTGLLELNVTPKRLLRLVLVTNGCSFNWVCRQRSICAWLWTICDERRVTSAGDCVYEAIWGWLEYCVVIEFQ